ncbi:MAG TPA: beta-propeller domain-containing protein [Pyrinomonadaceae bacterium]|nr:beta-propeller domain-containing protein [Pyrinomonadaceae bacterium]
MRTPFVLAIIATIFLAALVGYAQWPAETIPPLELIALISVKNTMRPFPSEQELANYLRELAKRQRGRLDDMKAESNIAGIAGDSAPQPTAVAKSKAAESITNTQQAGVDEGGIVKLHGDHLVVLRRGRLFTVKISDGALEPISSVDAFGPEINPNSTWYDEMLVSDDTVAVIGYSYERGGTEVGLFHIDDFGKLAYRSTYHLRSNDYYSSRNYASRLIGSKLIFYTPVYLGVGAEDPFQTFPAVRKWHKDAKPEEFQRIVSASRVYRPEHEFAAASGTALHTVTVCDLANGGFACNATAVLGPPGRVFYVSENSVYVWVSDWMRRGREMRADSMLYRMPLDGSEPSALGVSGSPVDQFSFLESEDNHLNVLVRSDLFLRNDGLHFEEAGELAARSDRAVDDACRASCVDWYGNARPLFFGGRVLALLGYEIVEGKVDDGRTRELRRVSYAPHRMEITSR